MSAPPPPPTYAESESMKGPGYQTSYGATQGGNPPNMYGPPQGAPYPPQGAPYPPQGAPYPPQGGAYPPQGGAYPPQGYPPQGVPPPPQYNAPAGYDQSKGYNQVPSYQTASTTNVVVQSGPQPTAILVGGCPSCRVGHLEDDFTCCGVLCAILFFPLGILCCLAMRQRRCAHCGSTFG